MSERYYTLKDAEEIFGGRRQIATYLGVSVQAVSKWAATGVIPAAYSGKIDEAKECPRCYACGATLKTKSLHELS